MLNKKLYDPSPLFATLLFIYLIHQNSLISNIKLYRHKMNSHSS